MIIVVTFHTQWKERLLWKSAAALIASTYMTTRIQRQVWRYMAFVTVTTLFAKHDSMNLWKEMRSLGGEQMTLMMRRWSHEFLPFHSFTSNEDAPSALSIPWRRFSLKLKVRMNSERHPDMLQNVYIHDLVCTKVLYRACQALTLDYFAKIRRLQICVVFFLVCFLAFLLEHWTMLAGCQLTEC